jgi:hypothetical protein
MPTIAPTHRRCLKLRFNTLQQSIHIGLKGRSIERSECFTFVVSTPFAIRLSAKGAAIDVMTIEPKGGRTDTYRKKNVNSKALHETGVKARYQ